MRILFASSECMPFIKTGGLADVAGTLPKAMAELAKENEIRVILPKYRRIPEKFRYNMRHVFDTWIHLGWRSQYLGIDEYVLDGVTYWFVDNEFYFGGDYVYGEGDFETERFCFFCKAVMESLPRLGFMPDVIHCNDWQTGWIPLLVRQYGIRPDYSGIKTVFTIHNLRFQGVGSRMFVDDLLALGQDALDRIEYSGGASAMKAGLMYCDRITTVSPTYAHEILTPEYGETLDCVLRDRAGDLCGILNGISTTLYDPMTDREIAVNYDKDSLEGKEKCKKALLRELGLAEDTSRPLVAVISRLTDQKGVDLISWLLPKIMNEGAQAVVLGMGDRHYEELFGRLSWENPSFAFRCEMNDALSRRIYAGADIFLMPSRFEPCGLSQMLALRYGCIPVVRETGGLADTVKPYNKFENSGNGFSFCGYSFNSFDFVTELALELFRDKERWHDMVVRAMECDFDWRVSAGKYLDLYRGVIGRWA
ncbi:MAG: glycogen synthase [Clostridia bacterium]|nr:glycogen synthase [Clostridia bacterium]